MAADLPPRGRTPLARLLTLLGLTGFAISQPLLAVAGEDPTLFTFAGVDGSGLVALALLVAFVPPVVAWLVVLLLDRLHPRAGQAAHLVLVALLAGAAAAQWAWAAGLDHRTARMGAGLLAGVALAALVVRVPVVAEWARYTAVLPPLAVALLLLGSPSSALLSSPERVDAEAADRDLAPVVFILLDELPLESLLADDGSIDAVRFPNLAELASEATWYPNYTVLANGTHQSVPSILTGRTPSEGRPVWTDHPDSLFSLLAPTHDLTVAEAATKLCGFETCGLEGASTPDRGLPTVLSQLAEVWKQRVGLERRHGPDLGQFADELVIRDPADALLDGEPDLLARPAAVADFIDALGSSRTPSLAFLHVMLPHQPWVSTPEGEPMVSLDQYQLAALGDVDPWELALLEQAHLFQLQYTDRLIGEVLDRERALGRYDRSVVVVTADHGVDFRSRPLRALDEETIADIAFVPLLVKAPGQHEAVVDDANVDARDLLPTIADLLGTQAPAGVEGLPAGSPEVAARGDDKFIVDFGDDFGRTPEHVYEFRAGDHRPSAARRRVGSIGPDDHPLAALLRTIGADGWLGTDVEGLTAGAGGTVALEPQGDHGALVAGRLAGRLEGAGPTGRDDLVLLAVDGVVQSASPVLGGGRVAFFVPPAAASTDPVQLRLFLVRGGEVTELATGGG